MRPETEPSEVRPRRPFNEIFCFPPPRVLGVVACGRESFSPVEDGWCGMGTMTYDN